MLQQRPAIDSVRGRPYTPRMDGGPNPLLQPGAESRWASLNAEKRRLLARPGDSLEDRLLRGQRLSAQAAALRRAIRDDRPRNT
jgi:hypothetical protein